VNAALPALGERVGVPIELSTGKGRCFGHEG
jgi:hypothetical protein